MLLERPMPNFRFWLFATLLAAAVGLKIHADMVPLRNSVILETANPALAGLRIAALSDLHLADDPSSLNRMATVLEAVDASQPDVIFLLGDYTGHPSDISDLQAHRTAVAELLATLKSAPVLAVLGNYESWDDRRAWAWELAKAGVRILENEVEMLEIAGRSLCVRGIGDAFTHNHRETQFPPSCQGAGLLTLTHDPYAAFDLALEGLVLAGHTHCGQVSLPMFGPLWVPSQAPRAATCGEYREGALTLWVSAGLGTSLLPIRFWAPASWDLLTLQ